MASYTSIKYIHLKESNNATVNQSLNREKDFSSVLIYVDEGAPLIQYLIENIDNWQMSSISFSIIFWIMYGQGIEDIWS